MKAIDRVRKARASLIMSKPFFGSLALKLKLEEKRSIPTLAVDGVTLFYNPDYVDSLTDEHLRSIVAHEVMHCALFHMTRRGNRDPKVWNEACDYAVNPLLVEAGFVLPEGLLLDSQYAGMGAEKIYAKLSEKPDEDGDEGDSGDQGDEGDQGGAGKDGSTGDDEGSGEGEPDGGAPDPGMCGSVIDAPPDAEGHPMSDTEIGEMERDWQVAVAQAAQLERAQGDLGAGMERMIEETLEPKANWRELLREFMNQVSSQDYSWTPPNRRFAYQGMYLPSMRSETLPPIVVAVDTSGSVSQSDLDQFASELRVILEEAKPEVLHVVYCDTSINSVQSFEPEEDLELEATGGGGTSFVPPFEWVEENDIEPACLIYLTDLYSSRFPDEPDYPVLWGVYGGNTSEPPFGEVIEID